MRLSDAEWSVMNVLWETAPASVRDVHEQLADETGWAYSTVKTLLERLVDKGAVSSRKRANAGIFEPVISRGQARRFAVHSLIEKAFDGTVGSLIQHMATEEKLSARDRQKLQQLLDESPPRETRSER